MSGSTGTIQTQAQLLAAFEDGQAAGSITPQDVRNLIVSVGPLAWGNEMAPLYSCGNFSGGASTIQWANGSKQACTLTTSTTVTLSINVGSGAIPGSSWAALDLYVVNNASGNGTLAFASNILFTGGAAPQPVTVANLVTKFRFESVDSGSNWSILF